jgi:hypothetical protein
MEILVVITYIDKGPVDVRSKHHFKGFAILLDRV